MTVLANDLQVSRRFFFKKAIFLKKKNIYIYPPKNVGKKCGSLLLAPFPMTPAWNTDSNVWRYQRHPKTMG